MTRDKYELAMLAGEWLARNESYCRLMNEAELAKKEMDSVKERLLNRYHRLRGNMNLMHLE